SQISHERIETPATCLNVGDEVEAKIGSFEVEDKKMNLSIKACLAEPERKPREDKGEGEGERKRTRAPRRSDDDELSSWSEGSVSVGTSLGDLLANAEKNKK
ncbi:MAG: hypothetical protein K2J54_02415, partial [Clostridia bacterium]|nr:hypothetical protein [Clostridia bacterium]